jgi:flagellar hook-associated protein FlgK
MKEVQSMCDKKIDTAVKNLFSVINKTFAQKAELHRTVSSVNKSLALAESIINQQSERINKLEEYLGIEFSTEIKKGYKKKKKS